MKPCFILYVLVAIFTTHVYAQQINTDSVSSRSHLAFGIDYQNDNVYQGRKDSLKLPYITPSIGYYHKSGLFVTASLSYLAAPENSRIDLIALEAGYQFEYKNFEAAISGVQYFYNNQSTSVKSEVKGSLNAYSAFDFGFLKPSLSATLNVSNKSDVDLMIGLEHSLYAIKNKLDITPSFFLNAGTQNYYGEYYNKRRYNVGRKRKRAAGVNYYSVTAQATNVSVLKLLDYEFDCPVNYSYKKLSFNFTPTFVIPVNPATLTLTVKSPAGIQYANTYPEQLSNVFYYSFGITCKL